MVSEISLGSWLTYGGGVERERAEACVAKAFEVGIDFIDTANVYSRGRRRSSSARCSPTGRETRTSSPPSSTGRCPTAASASPASRSSRSSTPRCGDCTPTTSTSTSATATTGTRRSRRRWQALTEVVRQGKVRYLGFSEWPAEKIREAQAMEGVEHFVSSQPQYSMLWRGPERDVIPASRELGISQIVWSPLAPGRPHREVQARRAAARGDAREPPSRWAASWRARSISGCWSACSSCALSPTSSACRWPSSRSPGCCGRRTSPRRSSARAGPSRSRTMPAPPGVELDSATLARIDEILGDSVAWEPPDSAR